MQKYCTGRTDFFVSEEIMEEYREEFGPELWEGSYLDNIRVIEEDMLRGRDEFKEYIRLFAGLRRREDPTVKDIGVLYAHGDSDGEWLYVDADEETPVQKWVDSQDGRYGALLLAVCNPGCSSSPRTHTPKTRASLLLAAESDVHFYDWKDAFCLDLIKPGGEIIDSYTIGYELEHLRKQLEEPEGRTGAPTSSS